MDSLHMNMTLNESKIMYYTILTLKTGISGFEEKALTKMKIFIQILLQIIGFITTDSLGFFFRVTRIIFKLIYGPVFLFLFI